MSTETEAPKSSNEDSKPARKPRSPRGKRERFSPKRLRSRIEVALERSAQVEDALVSTDAERLRTEEETLSSLVTDVLGSQGQLELLSEAYEAQAATLRPALVTVQWALRARGESLRALVRVRIAKTAVETAESLVRSCRSTELGIPTALLEELESVIPPARAALDQRQAMETKLSAQIDAYNAQVANVSACISILNGAVKRANAQRRVLQPP